MWSPLLSPRWVLCRPPRWPSSCESRSGTRLCCEGALDPEIQKYLLDCVAPQTPAPRRPARRCPRPEWPRAARAAERALHASGQVLCLQRSVDLCRSQEPQHYINGISEARLRSMLVARGSSTGPNSCAQLCWCAWHGCLAFATISQSMRAASNDALLVGSSAARNATARGSLH